VKKGSEKPNKLHLTLNGQNIIGWSRQKHQEIKQVIRPHIKPGMGKKRF
jgi:hypothetical protein